MTNIRTETKEQRLKRIIRELKQVLTDDKEETTVNHNSDKNEIDFILKIVSVSYGIMPSVILNSNKRGKVYESKLMCFCLLSECLGFTSAEIGKIFKRYDSQVSNELTRFSKLDIKNKIDAQFLNRFNGLKEDYIKENNN